ncbi:MAG: helix-turn-helix domain-containing protein, partial [Pseudomonadota bacterium]
DGTKPVLIDLMIDLRQHAEARRLPSGLLRLVLPLALHQAGLLPKAAPALLGGRLSLGTTRSEAEQEPMTLWLCRALSSLAKEATEAAARLADLQAQHRAWHQRLLREGLRGHSRLPLVLDLLAATPVVSAGLVAKHLDCTPQAAGRMLRQLAELGIVSEATATSRWKVYLAGDLASTDVETARADEPLVFSDPLPSVDHQAIEATLTDLFADLDRLERRTTSELASSR